MATSFVPSKYSPSSSYGALVRHNSTELSGDAKKARIAELEVIIQAQKAILSANPDDASARATLEAAEAELSELKAIFLGLSAVQLAVAGGTSLLLSSLVLPFGLKYLRPSMSYGKRAGISTLVTLVGGASTLLIMKAVKGKK